MPRRQRRCADRGSNSRYRKFAPGGGRVWPGTGRHCHGRDGHGGHVRSGKRLVGIRSDRLRRARRTSSADPELIAWDLASEAEHGADSASLLVTPSAALARAVSERLAFIIERVVPARRAHLQAVFGEAGRGLLVVTPSFDAACALAGRFAPEHLSIVCSPARQATALQSVVAGEVLLGAQTPFAAANYALGITAVLPTNGAARSLSGITSRDMLRVTTLGELDSAALLRLGPTIEALASYEGMPCHGAALRARYR